MPVAIAAIMNSFHTPCTAPLSPLNPSISILSSTSIRLRWSRPSTSNCRSIDGYRVTCTASGCSSLSVASTTQTTLTFYSAGVTSCNYQCCIQSYNNAGSSSERCAYLRKDITLYYLSVNSQLLFSIHCSCSRYTQFCAGNGSESTVSPNIMVTPIIKLLPYHWISGFLQQ